MMQDNVISSMLCCRHKFCWDLTILTKQYTFLSLFLQGVREEVKVETRLLFIYCQKLYLVQSTKQMRASSFRYARKILQ